MTVYIDDAMIKWRGMVMCHMMADSEYELDEIAKKMDLEVKWKQQGNLVRPPHYDVCLSKRVLALRFGAVSVAQHVLVKWYMNKIKESQQ